MLEFSISRKSNKLFSFREIKNYNLFTSIGKKHAFKNRTGSCKVLAVFLFAYVQS